MSQERLIWSKHTRLYGNEQKECQILLSRLLSGLHDTAAWSKPVYFKKEKVKRRQKSIFPLRLKTQFICIRDEMRFFNRIANFFLCKKILVFDKSMWQNCWSKMVREWVAWSSGLYYCLPHRRLAVWISMFLHSFV